MAINVGPKICLQQHHGFLFDKTAIDAHPGFRWDCGNMAVPTGGHSIEPQHCQAATQLTGIMIPDSVTNIGSQAFEPAPASRTFAGSQRRKLGDYAFNPCPVLTGFSCRRV